jgi:septal ring factor EnvC (AmiA/AmiB activator)
MTDIPVYTGDPSQWYTGSYRHLLNAGWLPPDDAQNLREEVQAHARAVEQWQENLEKLEMALKQSQRREEKLEDERDKMRDMLKDTENGQVAKMAMGIFIQLESMASMGALEQVREHLAKITSHPITEPSGKKMLRSLLPFAQECDALTARIRRIRDHLKPLIDLLTQKGCAGTVTVTDKGDGGRAHRTATLYRASVLDALEDPS